jgi:CDP-paratose 2-epimerase
MRFLITGGCGFIGSNLAASVLKRGDELAILDNLARTGSESNQKWLEQQGSFRMAKADIRSEADVSSLVRDFRPDVLFHLAGQVAMTSSIDAPRSDFEINALGSLNVLESVRHYAPECITIYSSTNKVYGDLAWVQFDETATRYTTPNFPNGFDEATPLDFRSPYGCSKGAADQYFLDYARIYNLRTVVFRHSSIYGGRQFATYDQGWIGWFCQKAREVRDGTANDPFTISGDGKQTRDVLHADDLIHLYHATIAAIDRAAGEAFNVGGGMENSLSLLELFELLENELGIRMKFRRLPWRLSDQRVFVANTSKAYDLLNWSPEVNKHSGIKAVIAWLDSLT